MKRRIFVLLAAGTFVATPAVSQFVPEPFSLNPIPAPLPPPPEPPIINGPIEQGPVRSRTVDSTPIEQGPPPGVAPQKFLNTFHDRTQRCNEVGTNAGLRGRRLSSYTRRCVNAQ